MNFRRLLLKSAYRVRAPRILEQIEFFKRNESQPAEYFAEMQLRKLKSLLLYCHANIPFYRELWDKHSVSAEIESLTDLEKFPLINKEMVQTGIAQKKFDYERFGKEKLLKQTTTGSSGTPFEFYEDRRCFDLRTSKAYAINSWFHYELGDKCARFWRGELEPSFFEKVKSYIKNVDPYCIYDPNAPLESALTQARIEEFIARLNKTKPKIIEGFVSALDLIATYLNAHGQKLKHKPKSIVTGAEFLSDIQRENISQAFGCPVYNRFGGTETGIIAHECTLQATGDHMLHIDTENLIIETIKAGKSVRGEPGEIVATLLNMRATPLIRYQTGDIATLDDSAKCYCGRTAPLMKDIEGRANDFFVLKDGKLLSTHLWQNYFKKLPFINRYQMIQSNLDRVDVSLIVDQEQFVEKDFEKLKKSVEAALPGVDVTWSFVEEIPLGPGGKFHHCISKLPAEQKRVNA
ncbi:MAG: phenylacetate--CoA ligase family protein [Deltaproteobacteria bacterium]|nr:phenylacetate--CoA ligase family protein [Deltaproteobacteria bacterium]